MPTATLPPFIKNIVNPDPNQCQGVIGGADSFEWEFLRSGKFFARPEGNWYCGPQGKKTEFNYKVVVRGERLDDHGFLIDGNAIGRICEVESVSNSCEMQAAMYLGQVFQVLKDTGVIMGVNSIEVSFGGQPNAIATARYSIRREPPYVIR